MRRDTEDLIQHLAENVRATQPLSRPWIRTGVWLAVSIPYLAFMLAVMVFWNGSPPVTFDARFLVEVV